MRRSMVAGVVLVVASLGLSACAERMPADQRLAAAQDATAAADTARLSLELAVQMGGDGAAMDTTLVGDGKIDFAVEQAALDMEMPGTDERGRAVVDGNVVYTQTDAGAGDERRWRRHDDAGGGPGALFGPGMSSGAPDPTSMLQTLGAAEGGIEALGTEEIRGERTEGFEFTAAPEALAGNADVRAELADVEVTVQAWLDVDNRVRRLVTEFALVDLVEPGADDADVPEEADRRFTLTLELFDFGSDVAIEVPSEDDIFDPTEPVGREREGETGSSTGSEAPEHVDPAGPSVEAEAGATGSAEPPESPEQDEPAVPPEQDEGAEPRESAEPVEQDSHAEPRDD